MFDRRVAENPRMRTAVYAGLAFVEARGAGKVTMVEVPARLDRQVQRALAADAFRARHHAEPEMIRMM